MSSWDVVAGSIVTDVREEEPSRGVFGRDGRPTFSATTESLDDEDIMGRLVRSGKMGREGGLGTTLCPQAATGR